MVPFNPKPVRRVIADYTAENLSKMLVSVVSDDGTARRAKIEGFSVAVKLGPHKKLSMVDIRIVIMLLHSLDTFPLKSQGLPLQW